MTESIRVLSVDDEPEFADLTVTLLEREDEGMTVDTVTNADEALDRLAEIDYDCIVSDYDMPGMDGIEFLDAVRERYHDLPFILFTGKGSEEVASEAISAGVTDYLQKQASTGQYDLLANRIRNAVEQTRVKKRAAELDRIRTLSSDINQALVRADDRIDAEERVCEILSRSDPYLFAWIGEVDPETTQIRPRSSAGIESDYLDAVTITADESHTGQGPAGTAIRDRRVVISQNVADDPAFEPWREEALDRGFWAVAAIPLEYRETLFGLLVVYADRPQAFDENERELLEDLGADVAHAFQSFEMQERLRNERDRRRALFENAPNPVLDGRIEDDQFLVKDVNAAFEDVFGYEAEDLLGRDLAESIVPDERQDRHDQLREKTATGETVVAEVERMTTDGPREFLLHGIPYSAGNGQSGGCYAWYTDISEQKARERKLEETTARIQAQFDNSPNMIVVHDDEGELLDVNERVREVLGYEEGELEGRYVWDIDETVDPDRAREFWEEMPTEEVRRFEGVNVRKDGSTLPVEIHLVRLDVEGEDRFVSMFYDISARKARERQLQQKNDRLEKFASVVSHDLKNPLGTAQLSADLARRDGGSEHFDRLERSLDRMERIVEDVLWLTREGHEVGTTERVDLRTVAQESWSMVVEHQERATIEFGADVGMIHADPDRLRQLLENVFSNAVDHAGPDVTVTVESLSDGFAIADDGPGIPESDREQVFEHGYSTDDGGTGLGLTIVRDVAEAHGWEVSVTESDDGGARFEITGVGRFV